MNFKPASPKLEILYKKAPYKLIHGGRGSAKSWGVGEALVYYSNLQFKNPLKILCAREFQNSIKDSSKALLENTIERFELSKSYDITNTSIIHKITGAEFVFSGLARNLQSIKSMEGINICWVEEGQNTSSDSWDVLLPTIRGNGAELWVTWNSYLPTDPIENLVKNPYPGTLIEEMNYYDNPHFPDNLRKQMEHDKATDTDKYNHVWLGKYIDVGDNKLISYKSVMEAQERKLEKINTFRVAALDPARYGDDDADFIVREGNEIIFMKSWAKCSVPELALEAANLIAEWNVKCCSIDVGGLAGVYDLVTQKVNERACRVLEFNGGATNLIDSHYANKRAHAWCKMRDWVQTSGVLPHNQGLVAELIQQEYKYNERTQLQLITKEQMRKNGIKSPNKGDALAMTFDPAVRPPDQVQQRQYEGRFVG